MKYLLLLSLFLFSSCSVFEPSYDDMFYTEYETNPDYTTRKMGPYFVVLTFRSHSSYNNYTSINDEYIWRMGDNAISIKDEVERHGDKNFLRKDVLRVNKRNFGSVVGAQMIKITKSKVYVDGKARKALAEKITL